MIQIIDYSLDLKLGYIKRFPSENPFISRATLALYNGYTNHIDIFLPPFTRPRYGKKYRKRTTMMKEIAKTIAHELVHHLLNELDLDAENEHWATIRMGLGK